MRHVVGGRHVVRGHNHHYYYQTIRRLCAPLGWWWGVWGLYCQNEILIIHGGQSAHLQRHPQAGKAQCKVLCDLKRSCFPNQPPWWLIAFIYSEGVGAESGRNVNLLCLQTFLESDFKSIDFVVDLIWIELGLHQACSRGSVKFILINSSLSWLARLRENANLLKFWKLARGYSITL